MQKLRTAMSRCDTIRFTNGSGDTLDMDSMHKVEDTIGVVVEETENAAEGMLVHRAPAPGVLLPCPAAAAGVFAAGDNVYYDATARNVVNESDKSGNIYCGTAYKAAVQADTEVQVDFDGMAGRGIAES